MPSPDTTYDWTFASPLVQVRVGTAGRCPRCWFLGDVSTKGANAQHTLRTKRHCDFMSILRCNKMWCSVYTMLLREHVTAWQSWRCWNWEKTCSGIFLRQFLVLSNCVRSTSVITCWRNWWVYLLYGNSNDSSSVTVVQYLLVCLSSVLWRCWLGSRKGIQPVENLSGGVLAWLSGARCRLAYGPADASATHSLLLQ